MYCECTSRQFLTMNPAMEIHRLTINCLMVAANQADEHDARWARRSEAVGTNQCWNQDTFVGRGTSSFVRIHMDGSPRTMLLGRSMLQTCAHSSRRRRDTRCRRPHNSQHTATTNSVRQKQLDEQKRRKGTTTHLTNSDWNQISSRSSLSMAIPSLHVGRTQLREQETRETQSVQQNQQQRGRRTQTWLH